MVAMRDTLALKNTRLGLETLERMDYDRRKVKILLNRANTNVGIEREDVLAILGRDVDILVPSDRDITRSINQGTPIALESANPAAKAFRGLAQMYNDGFVATPRINAPAPAPAPQQGRKSLFLRRKAS